MELHCQNKPGQFELLYKTKKGTCVKGLVIGIKAIKLLMEELLLDTYPDLL